MPTIFHQNRKLFGNRKMYGGATAEQKGRASELRTYIMDYDTPPGTITDPDAAGLKFRLNKIVHSGDKNPYQNYLGVAQPNKFADDPVSNKAFWGAKNLYDPRAQNLIDKAEFWKDRFEKIPARTAKAAALANIGPRAQSITDRAKVKVKQEQEAAAKAFEESALGQRLKAEAEAAEAAKEEKKRAKKQRDAELKEERRLLREAEEAEKAKAAAEVVKAEAEAKKAAEELANAEAKAKQAEAEAKKKEQQAIDAASKKAEKKQPAAEAKKKQQAASAATQPKKKKGGDKKAAADDDFAFLEEQAALAKKEAEDLKKKREREAMRDLRSPKQKFDEKKREAIDKVSELPKSANIKPALIIFDRNYPDGIVFFETDSLYTKGDIQQAGEKVIDKYGTRKMLILFMFVGRILADLNTDTSEYGRNFTPREMELKFPEMFRGNYEYMIGEDKWTREELDALPTTISSLLGNIILTAIWRMEEDSKFINGRQTDGVEIYASVK